MAAPNPQRPRGSWLSILLVLCAAVLITAGLVFLTLTWFALVVVIAAGIFALAAFHYVVWGWWLSKIVRHEEEEIDSNGNAGRDWPDSTTRP